MLETVVVLTSGMWLAFEGLGSASNALAGGLFLCHSPLFDSRGHCTEIIGYALTTHRLIRFGHERVLSYS